MDELLPIILPIALGVIACCCCFRLLLKCFCRDPDKVLPGGTRGGEDDEYDSDEEAAAAAAEDDEEMDKAARRSRPPPLPKSAKAKGGGKGNGKDGGKGGRGGGGDTADDGASSPPPDTAAPANGDGLHGVPAGFAHGDLHLLPVVPDSKLAAGVYSHSIPGLSSSWEQQVASARDDVREFVGALEIALSRRQEVAHTPPAWQWLLALCYEHYPPAAMDHSASRREAEAVRALDVGLQLAGGPPASPVRTPAVKHLRKALVQYHPDKNRAEQYGVRWAAFCEEIAKLYTRLLADETASEPSSTNGKHQATPDDGETEAC